MCGATSGGYRRPAPASIWGGLAGGRQNPIQVYDTVLVAPFALVKVTAEADTLLTATPAAAKAAEVPTLFAVHE